VRIEDIEQRLAELRILAGDLPVDARAELREPVEQPVDVRIVVLPVPPHQPPRDLREACSEVARLTTQVRQRALVIR
jgi:hypothetical protein